MTTVAEPPLHLPPGWRDQPDEWKQLFAERLRIAAAARAAELRRAESEQAAAKPGSWDTPSALATSLFPGYVPAPHLTPIDEAFLDADSGKVDRILLCTPPQVGKSTTAAEAGPLWWLSRHRSARVTVASYALKLAARRGQRCRDMIKAYGQTLGLDLTPGSQAVAEWDLASGGGMICTGVEGGLTGFGSDMMVIDDPHKNREEANSETIRKSIEGWYQSTVETRMAPGAPVILIMTRWHKLDLASFVLKNEGRIEDGGRWKVVSLPAIAEGQDDQGQPVADPLGRAPGDPLTHPKLPGADRGTLMLFWQQKRNAVGSREWPALYQQRPSDPEGTVWRWDWIDAGRLRPEQMPELGKRIVAVDPSATDKATSDACGIVVCAKGAVDRQAYILDDVSKIATPLEWGKTACRAAILWDCTEIVAEGTGAQQMITLTIRTAWRDIIDEAHARGELRHLANDMPPRVVLVQSRVGKRIRAEPVAALYEAAPSQVHHVGDRLGELETEQTGWNGEGKSPNRLDALVHGVTYLMLASGAVGRSESVGELLL